MKKIENFTAQTFMPPITEEVRRKLEAIVADTEAAERFYDAFYEQFITDEEPPEKKGHYMAKALLANNAEDFLLAICGWSAESLLRFAEV